MVNLIFGFIVIKAMNVSKEAISGSGLPNENLKVQNVNSKTVK
jgi:hypothetical protein